MKLGVPEDHIRRGLSSLQTKSAHLSGGMRSSRSWSLVKVAMVAAHLGDLAAARSHGLRTIYVERLRREAWGAEEAKYTDAKSWVDIWVTEDEEGFIEVARRFGI